MSKPYLENFESIASSGVTALAIALGHNLGLFNFFKTTKDAATAKDIAENLKLKERYVREWLGCMVAAEIVYVDKEGKYYIPEDCKPALGVSLLAAVVPLLAKTSSDVEACFRLNGPTGFDYSERTEFLEWLDEDQKHSIHISADKLVSSVKSFKDLDSIKSILDLGCGTGRLVVCLSKTFQSASITGVDVAEGGIEKAKRNAEEDGSCSKKARRNAEDRNCSNVNFRLQSITDLPDDWTNTFDWIILWDVLHDLSYPVQALNEIKRVLKDDGIVSIVDPRVHSNHSENAGNKRAANLYTFSLFACLPCSLSSTNGAGHGMGWGAEEEEKFILSNGMQILDKQVIGPTGDASLFICRKLNQD